MKKWIFVIIVLVLICMTIWGVKAETDCIKNPDHKDCIPLSEQDKEYKDKIKKYPFVEIEFQEEIISKKDWKDLEKSIKHGYNYIEITDKELKKEAKVTFKSLFLINPVAVHNGIIDYSIQVTQEGYGIYSIEVDSWSSYSIFDNTWNGTFEGTSLSAIDGSLIIEPLAVVDYDFTSLEDDINIDDQGVYGNDAELTTSPNYNTSCKYGSDCLNWDGVNDYLITELDFDDLPEFSISAWITPDTTAGTWHPILTQGMNSNSGIMFSQNANQIFLHLPNGAFESIKYDDTTLVAGNTYHIVSTFNGSVAKLYLDGVKETTDKNMTKNPSGGDLTTIGASLTTQGAWSSEEYNGNIECIQVYDFELDNAEVTALNNSATCDPSLNEPIWTSPLVGWTKYQYDYNAYNDVIGTAHGEWLEGTTIPVQMVDDFCVCGSACLEFDGINDYINLSDTNGFDNNESRAHSFYVTDLRGTGTEVIFSKSNPTPTYTGEMAYLATGILYYRYYENGTSSGLRVYAPSVDFSDGETRFVVINYNGSGTADGVEMWIDGVEQSLTTSLDTGFTGSTLNNAERYIGLSSYGSLPFEGIIEDYTIYDQILPEDVILALNDTSDESCDYTLYDDPTMDSSGIYSIAGTGVHGYGTSGGIDGQYYQFNLTDDSVSYMYRPGGLTPNTVYCIEADIYYHNVGGTNLFRIQNSNGANIWSNSVNDEWQHVSECYTVGTGDYYRFRPYGNATTFFRMDNIYITEQSVAEYPLSPIMADMGAFGVQENDETYLNSTSLECDGIDDYVNAYDFTEDNKPLSISAWVKSYDNHKGGVGSIYSAFASNKGPWLYVTNTGSVSFRIGNGTAGTTLTSTSTYLDEWVHITGTFDNETSTIKLYFNGVYDKSITVAGNIVAPVGITPAFCGLYNGGSNYNFDGLLDEINIFERVLTPEEIELLYNGTSMHFEPNGTYTSEVYNSSDYDEDIETNVWLTSIFSGTNISAGVMAGGSQVTYFLEDFTGNVFNATLFETFEEGDVTVNTTNNRFEITGFGDETGDFDGGGLDLLLTNTISAGDFITTVDIDVTINEIENNTLIDSGIEVWADGMMDDYFDCLIININSSDVGGYVQVLQAMDEMTFDYIAVPSLTGTLEMDYNLTTSNLTCRYNGYEVSITSAISENTWFASLISDIGGYDEMQPYYGDINVYYDNWEFESYAIPIAGEISGEQVEGRAGDCTTIGSYPWIPASGLNQNFTFMGVNGECFQYKLTLDGDYETTPTVDNVTIEAYKVKLPYIEELNWSWPFPNYDATSTLQGYTTLLLDDIEQLAYDETWFYHRDGTTTPFGDYYGLAFGNGSFINTQPFGDFQKDDQVWYCITPITLSDYGTATGDTYCIENVTIQNSDFTVTWKPNQNTTTLTAKPLTGRRFSAELTDIDNDVVVYWYVDDVFSGTGEEWYYLPEMEDIESIYTITGFATDGEFNETAEWEIFVEEGDMTLAIIIGMGIVGAMLLFFAFKLEEKHFLLKLLFIFLALIVIILIPTTFVIGLTKIVDNFLKVALWTFGIFVIYFMGYLFYYWTKTSETFMKWFK